MAENPFQIDTPAPDRLVLRGAFDISAVADFRRGVLRLREEGTRSLVVDLSGLSFLDSSGLGELLRLEGAVRRDGHELTMVRPPEDVAATFAMTGLEQHFAWVDDAAGS